MECAGNGRLGMTPLPSGAPWGHGAVSAAYWTGVPLRAVLERVGVRDDAIEILAEGGDGFARALPIEDALDPSTLLAFEMNGRPLPPEHGGPLRLLVPGWYGMASVKWLVHIQPLTEPYAGFQQKERYVYDDDAPVTRMRVKSRITRPRVDEVVARGEVRVSGWAWSGFADVRCVEVSLDGGDDWTAATLGRALSPHTWCPWQVSFYVEHPGRHTLRARAIDASGHVQPDAPPWNRLGYGNNAVLLCSFYVREWDPIQTISSAYVITRYISASRSPGLEYVCGTSASKRIESPFSKRCVSRPNEISTTPALRTRFSTVPAG